MKLSKLSETLTDKQQNALLWERLAVGDYFIAVPLLLFGWQLLPRVLQSIAGAWPDAGEYPPLMVILGAMLSLFCVLALGIGILAVSCRVSIVSWGTRRNPFRICADGEACVVGRFLVILALSMAGIILFAFLVTFQKPSPVLPLFETCLYYLALVTFSSFFLRG